MAGSRRSPKEFMLFSNSILCSHPQKNLEHFCIQCFKVKLPLFASALLLPVWVSKLFSPKIMPRVIKACMKSNRYYPDPSLWSLCTINKHKFQLFWWGCVGYKGFSIVGFTKEFDRSLSESMHVSALQGMRHFFNARNRVCLSKAVSEHCGKRIHEQIWAGWLKNSLCLSCRGKVK